MGSCFLYTMAQYKDVKFNIFNKYIVKLQVIELEEKGNVRDSCSSNQNEKIYQPGG